MKNVFKKYNLFSKEKINEQKVRDKRKQEFMMCIVNIKFYGKAENK